MNEEQEQSHLSSRYLHYEEIGTYVQGEPDNLQRQRSSEGTSAQPIRRDCTVNSRNDDRKVIQVT